MLREGLPAYVRPGLLRVHGACRPLFLLTGVEIDGRFDSAVFVPHLLCVVHECRQSFDPLHLVLHGCSRHQQHSLSAHDLDREDKVPVETYSFLHLERVDVSVLVHSLSLRIWGLTVAQSRVRKVQGEEPLLKLVLVH